MLDTPLTRSVFLSRSDPRVRLIAALASAVLLSTLGSVEAASAALAAAVAALSCSRPRVGVIITRLLAVNGFIAFLALGLSVSLAPGTGWLPAIELIDNRRLIALIALKTNAIACCLMLFMGSMAPSTVGYALDRLRVPASLTCVFLFTLRFIHAIHEEYARLMNAARLRGFRPRTSLHSYRTLATLLGVLLMRGYHRARRVHEAMLLRGFNGQFRVVTTFTPGWRDGVLACALAATLACVMALDAGGWPAADALAVRIERMISLFLA